MKRKLRGIAAVAAVWTLVGVTVWKPIIILGLAAAAGVLLLSYGIYEAAAND